MLASTAALGGLFAATAGAATTVPQINTASLEAALQGAGVSSSQIQALINDLIALQTTGTAPNLAGDLDAVIAAIGQATGQSPVVQPVLDSLTSMVDNLLGGTPTPSQIQSVIDQLQDLSGTSGLVPAVGNALSQLAEGLTGSDLPELLSQAGSPLSSTAVQTILDELAALQSLPADTSIPAGALSGVAQALDTVAQAPGVPAAVAGTLEDAASTLGSTSPVTPSELSSVLPGLANAVPSLDSVPVTGPALGSLVGGLTDQLASTPAGAAGSGGAGGAGGASGGSSTTGEPTYITYLQSAAASGPAIGASITSLSYKGGKVHVALSCPKALTAGCKTTINLGFGSWKFPSKKVTIAAGKKKTALVGLPHLATVAAKQGRAINVTATTGSYTTHTHTIHIKIKH